MDQREDQRRDAEQHRNRQRDAAREEPQHGLILAVLSPETQPCVWSSFAPSTSCGDRHFVARKAAVVERVFRIGIAEGVRAVLDGALLHVLIV